MRCSFNDQFIHQHFFYASHKRILQMTKLGIYTGLTKSIPNPPHLCSSCIISKGTWLARNPNVSTEKLDPGSCFHLESNFFNKTPCQNFASSLTIVDATNIQLFGYPTRSKPPTLQLIHNFINFLLHHGYKRYIFWVDKVGYMSIPSDFMQIFIEHEVIVETTVWYEYSINVKVEHPQQTINNMVHIKLLSYGHSAGLWCFCYQYTIWIISRLINRRMGKDPIVSWYSNKNIYYIIPFTDLVIWILKIYIINYKQRKKELGPRTNIDPFVCPPYIDPYLFPQSADGLLMGYSNYTKFNI